MGRSNSELSGISYSQRCREWIALFRMAWNGRKLPNQSAKWLDAVVAEYEEVYSSVTHKSLKEATIFEIGYGARPLRLIWLLSNGFNAWGVDLDKPTLSGNPSELLAIARNNGLQRFLKSTVRHYFFDRGELRALTNAIKQRGFSHLRFDRERFIVGDAAKFDMPADLSNGVDFIYSEDVLEHIPREALAAALNRMADMLHPDGCALFRPLPFSSLSGGHLTDWYAHKAKTRSDPTECETEPWEHLRKNRVQANTYLNKLRIQDYREMLSERFEIIRTEYVDSSIAERYLTDDIRAELSEYSDEELTTQTVLFVCVPLNRPHSDVADY
jgi:SAM-dependent methyltransferase